MCTFQGEVCRLPERLVAACTTIATQCQHTLALTSDKYPPPHPPLTPPPQPRHALYCWLLQQPTSWCQVDTLRLPTMVSCPHIMSAHPDVMPRRHVYTACLHIMISCLDIMSVHQCCLAWQ